MREAETKTQAKKKTREETCHISCPPYSYCKKERETNAGPSPGPKSNAMKNPRIS